ncbi:hypothetical protein Clacol_010025 [Clathrus columnatus]|uniref:Uncharacterized protein n=1 Tax=Clathrus columnatus TaxID=1419009 RepID=A0AAV5APR5_9AGAM|nr:hypothetical protein Clacol_010025 [Clathrus columnatus]
MFKRLHAVLTGSSIGVLGTVNVTDSPTTPNPTWQCLIDGIAISSNPPQVPENHWQFCGGNVPDGPHELTLNVTSNGILFYLDYISYRASPSVSLENSVIPIENPDPAFDFISGWSPIDGIANQTTDPNGLLNMTFIGIQLAWYGFIPIEVSHFPSSGVYSIDGGSSIPFQIPGLPSGATTSFFNQLFFTTPTLDMGSHVLSVKYTGTSGQIPLTLDYVNVLNGSFPSSSTTSSGEGSNNNNRTRSHTSNSTPTPTLSNHSSSTNSPISTKKGSSTAGIVGGVLGFIIGLSVVIFIWYIFYRRRRKQRQRDTIGDISPYFHQYQPTTFIPPTQIIQIPRPKDQTQYAPQLSGNPANFVISINPGPNLASLPTTSYQNSLPTVTAVLESSGASTSRNAASTALTSSSTMPSRVPVRHEDSGIRLGPSVAAEEVLVRDAEFVELFLSFA